MTKSGFPFQSRGLTTDAVLTPAIYLYATRQMFLTIIAAGCLFLLMQGKNIRHAAIFGWLFGLGLFGSGASWVFVSIHDFAYTSATMAASV